MMSNCLISYFCHDRKQEMSFQIATCILSVDIFFISDHYVFVLYLIPECLIPEGLIPIVKCQIPMEC